MDCIFTMRSYFTRVWILPIHWEEQREVDNRSLFEAVAVLRRFEASDPRDKVYSALGLCVPPPQPADKPAVLPIQPTYGLMLATETYLEAARSIIYYLAHSDELAILAFAEGR